MMAGPYTELARWKRVSRLTGTVLETWAVAHPVILGKHQALLLGIARAMKACNLDEMERLLTLAMPASPR